MTNESVLTDQQLRQYRDSLTNKAQETAEAMEPDDIDGYDYCYLDGMMDGIKWARAQFDKLLEEVKV